MKKKTIIIFLVIIATIFFSGCNSQINPDSSSAPISPSATISETPFWIEYEGLFHTLDLVRAQKEIPFTIILPTYFPDDSRRKTPSIIGPLKEFQQNDKIEVKVMYDLYPGENLSGIIIIYETNYISSLGDPELNPELERVEIGGLSVLKTKDDWSSERDAYYSFNSNDIYYNVEIHGLPNEESHKIVESIITQLKQ